MEYKQIKPKKIYEEVADTLIEFIRSGKLKPGEKLDSVQKLAENFHVGRSAVREALTSLRAMGLIEMRQGEGTYVKLFSSDSIAFPIHTTLLMDVEDLEELMDVRKVLETGIAYKAAQNRTTYDLEKMEKALIEMVSHPTEQEAGEKADFDFHLAIAEATGNKLLASLMHHISDMTAESMREARRIALYSESMVFLFQNQHKKILDAIRKQDGDVASIAMGEHLDAVKKMLMGIIDKSASK